MTGPLFSGLGETKPRVSRGYDGNITYNYAILYIYMYIYTHYLYAEKGIDGLVLLGTFAAKLFFPSHREVFCGVLPF